LAKQIIWSSKAKDDLFSILEYWNHRNKSKTYSKKLNFLIKDAIEIIADHPKTGRPSDFENVRILIVRDYHILYEEIAESVNVLRIWDNRRDETKLEL